MNRAKELFTTDITTEYSGHNRTRNQTKSLKELKQNLKEVKAHCLMLQRSAQVTVSLIDLKNASRSR